MEGPAEKLGLYSQNEGENLSGSHMNMDVNSLPSLLCSGRFQILPKDLKIPVSQVRVEKWSCKGHLQSLLASVFGSWCLIKARQHPWVWLLRRNPNNKQGS